MPICYTLATYVNWSLRFLLSLVCVHVPSGMISVVSRTTYAFAPLSWGFPRGDIIIGGGCVGCLVYRIIIPRRPASSGQATEALIDGRAQGMVAAVASETNAPQ